MAGRKPGEGILADTLKHLPDSPGVYQFKDARGEIIYIGKAKSLRKRVRSYFASDHKESLKTQELVKRIVGLETIVVQGEADALILEATLIRRHRPRFNIAVRDDKQFPFIQITVQEAFPRVLITRKVARDGSRTFGPYTEVTLMRSALDFIRRAFHVRSCSYDIGREKVARPCLDYHIGRCHAPCVGLQSKEEYRAMIDQIILVLSGKTDVVRKEVEAAMSKASAAREYEEAARLRDALAGLTVIEDRQQVFDVSGGDQDVIGLARDGDVAVAALLRVRDGRLLGRQQLVLENVLEVSDAELTRAILARIYLGSGEEGFTAAPDLIAVRELPDEADILESLLTSRTARSVKLVAPQRGDRRRVLELAEKNARHLLEERSVLARDSEVRAADELYDLQAAVGLKVVPRSIVCFDISHTQGSETVGSAAFFENAAPRKAEYRKFKVRSPVGNDDFRSIHEVVTRYFTRRLEEAKPLPELTVIDGGKGQLSSALDALEALGLADLAVISLAKREEEVFLPGRGEGLKLGVRSPGLHLLQRIRDEAHRFAVGYNRKLRGKRTLRSRLSDIEGIGPKRQRELLAEFGSVRTIRDASIEEISALPGFSAALAKRLKDGLVGDED